MIIRDNKPVEVCVCDHVSCGATKRSDVDVAWKMYGIHFGVHSSIKEFVVTRIDHFNFCENDARFYKDIIFALMLQNGFSGGLMEGKCSTSAEYEEGLGCWITLIDVIGGHPPMNFQMPYEMFAKIYLSFVGLGVRIRMWGSLNFQEQVEELRRFHR